MLDTIQLRMFPCATVLELGDPEAPTSLDDGGEISTSTLIWTARFTTASLIRSTKLRTPFSRYWEIIREGAVARSDEIVPRPKM